LSQCDLLFLHLDREWSEAVHGTPSCLRYLFVDELHSLTKVLLVQVAKNFLPPVDLSRPASLYLSSQSRGNFLGGSYHEIHTDECSAACGSSVGRSSGSSDGYLRRR